VPERDVIVQLESQIREAVESSGVGEYDGHEFGAGVARLFAYGPNADRLYAVVQPVVLKFKGVLSGVIGRRYGGPGAREVAEEF
jgi:hypothetical protein